MKQVNHNFLNVVDTHVVDTLELMLFVHSQVMEAIFDIDISHALYSFIELKDFQYHLKANNLISIYISFLR